MSRFLRFVPFFVAACASLGHAETRLEPVCGNTFSSAGSAPECLALMRAQVASSHAVLFAAVTSDIGALSRFNLASLSAAVASKRPLSDEHRTRASRRANAFVRSLALAHATSMGSAVAILRSGALLSKDELVRRGILPIESKRSMTDPNTEGAIGEQDVVYLALQPRVDSGAYSFGDVSFTFDAPRALADGYFSLNSFNVGYSLHGRPLAEMVESYRPMVFKGWDSVVELARLSALNDEWLRANPTVMEFARVAGREGADRPPGPSFDACGALHAIDQAESGRPCPLDGFGPENREELRRQIADGFRSLLDPEDDERLLRSFKLFPAYGARSRLPISGRNAHWFWEFKVPNRMGLDRVLSISYPTTRTINNMQNGVESRVQEQIDGRPLEEAVAAFAGARGWGVVRTVSHDGGRVLLTFRKP